MLTPKPTFRQSPRDTLHGLYRWRKQVTCMSRVCCLAAHPPSGQPGLLVLEHLVAEVVGLGFEVVLPGHSLVAHNEKGSCPCHHSKDGHHDEDDVAGSQAQLRIWRLTCRGGDRHRWEVCPKREESMSLGGSPSDPSIEMLL